MKVRINDNDLEVEVFGPEGAPLIIAHHGGPGVSDRREPRAAYEAFADTFRVLVFDARGSGESEGSPPFDHQQFVDDVDALRAWAGADKFVMAGGSYGGFVSLEYAIRHSDRLHALVLRDTSPTRLDNETVRENARSSERGEIDLDKVDRVLEGRIIDDADFRECWREILPLYDHDYDPENLQGLGQPLDEKVDNTYYHFETHNFAFSQNMVTYDVTGQLGRIDCPTLVTVGRSDWITPVSSSETIAAGIRGAELVIFENSGHSPQIEEKERWQQVVRTFLSSVEAHPSS